MAKESIIRIHIDSKLKKEVDKILQELGISTPELIKILYAQIRLRRGLPFPIQLPDAPEPNEETRKALNRPFDPEKDFIYDNLEDAMKDEKNW